MEGLVPVEGLAEAEGLGVVEGLAEVEGLEVVEGLVEMEGLLLPEGLAPEAEALPLASLLFVSSSGFLPIVIIPPVVSGFLISDSGSG